MSQFSLKDLTVVNYPQTEDEYVAYRAQKRKRLSESEELSEKAPDTEAAMRRYRSGNAGSTDIAHLKAKGLIPRADGTKRKSPQYESVELDENFFENIMKFLSDRGFIESPQAFNDTIRRFLKIGNYKTRFAEDVEILDESALSDIINKIAGAMADDMDKEMKRSARQYDADKYKRKKMILALRKYFSNSEIQKIYKMLMGSKPGSASRRAVIKKVKKELKEAMLMIA